MTKTINPPRRNLKRLFLFNGILLVVAFAIIQYSVLNNTPKSPIQPAQVNPSVKGVFAERLTWFDNPQEIQDLNFKTVFDKEMFLQESKGQWVILNFWATWCPPCIVEMPSLQALQDEFLSENVKVIAISLDRHMDGKKLREFIKKYKFGPVSAHYAPWPVVKEKFDVKGLPTTYIIGPSGHAYGIFRGEADWMSEDAQAFISSLAHKD